MFFVPLLCSLYHCCVLCASVVFFVPLLCSLYHCCVLCASVVFFVPLLCSLCHCCVLCVNCCVRGVIAVFFMSLMCSSCHCCVLYSLQSKLLFQSFLLLLPPPQNKIPVLCPALTDGSIGDMLFFHSYKNPGLVLDIIQGTALNILFRVRVGVTPGP